MPAGETSERAENSRFAAVYTAERPVIEMFTEGQLYKWKKGKTYLGV